MYYYTYKITHKESGRYYIGARSSKVEPNNDKYMGSGKLIRQAIKKYGMDAFEKAILNTYETFDEAFKAECLYLDNYLTDPLCYNIAPGGKGGDRFSTHENKEQYRQRLKKSRSKHLSTLTKNDKQRLYASKGFLGKNHTEQTNDKNRVAHAKFTYTLISPLNEQFITISLNEFCKHHNLNRDILMKYIGKGKIPNPRNYGKETRMNTVGWEINIL